MAKVYAPLKTYTGISASVRFVNGVGETSDPDLLKWFEKHNYTVETKEVENEEIEKPKRRTRRKAVTENEEHI